jgi:predicted transcriptional regulator
MHSTISLKERHYTTDNKTLTTTIKNNIMRHKYITSLTRLACLSKPAPAVNIHELLEETINERKRVLQRLEEKTRVARRIEWYIIPGQAA